MISFNNVLASQFSASGIFNIEFFENSNLASSLGWSLVHFLWQATVIAIFVGLLLSFIGRTKSQWRYLVCCFGLVAMALAPVLTFPVCLNFPNQNANIVSDRNLAEAPNGETTVVPSTANPSIPNSGMPLTNIPNKIASNADSQSALAGDNQIVKSNVPKTTDVNKPANLISRLNPTSNDSSLAASTAPFWKSISSTVESKMSTLLPWFVLVWIVGVVILTARLVINYIRTGRLKNSGQPVRDKRILAELENLVQKMGLRVSVQLRQSVATHTPMVLGWLKPVIILPMSAITGLSQHEIAAILSHELAHVRRADYAVNLLQSVLEVALFYHPAVWWMSARIRQERENCCDDMAADVLENKKLYASALLSLEKCRQQSPGLALNANGGDLLARIQRLCVPAERQRSNATWMTTALMVTLIVGTLAAFSLEKPASAAPSTAAIESGLQANQEKQEKEKQGAAKKKAKNSELPTSVEVTAVDADGKPVGDVQFHAGVWESQYRDDPRTMPPNSFYHTDEKGKATIKLPKTYYILRVWITRDGYVPMSIGWEEAQIKGGDVPPKKLTVTLVKGIEVGGVVKDSSGKPILGATVSVRCRSSRHSGTDGPRLGGGLASIKTDKNGIWAINNAPAGDHWSFSVKARHEDYIRDDKSKTFTAEKVIEKSASITLEKGIVVKGAITGPDGTPVKKGIVVFGDMPYWDSLPSEVFIDEGKYEFPAMAGGEIRLTVVAPGLAPFEKMVNISKDMKDVDFKLKKGNTIRIKIVDENDEPMPHTYVGVRKWRDAESLYNVVHPNVKRSEIPGRAGGDGIYEWTWAPEDAVVYGFGARGYVYMDEISLKPSDKIQTIKMIPELRVSGKVVDHETGKGLDNFKVIPLVHLRPKRQPNRSHERRDQLAQGKRGRFDIKLGRPDCSYRLLIEADGYEQFKTDLFKIGDEVPPFEISLKCVEAKTIFVRDDKGNPVTDAKLMVGSESNRIHMGRNYSLPFSEIKTYKLDENGAVSVPKSGDERTMIVMGKDGYSQTFVPKNEDVPDLVLYKWAQAKGRFLFNGKPIKNTTAVFFPTDLGPTTGRHLQARSSADLDEEGHFRFDRLPAMRGQIVFLTKFEEDVNSRRMFSRFSIPVHLKPGEIKEIDFSAGTRITGKLDLDENVKKLIEFDGSQFTLKRTKEGFATPKQVADMNLDMKNLEKTMSNLYRSGNYSVATALNHQYETYSGYLNADGSFDMNVLSPGEYTLSLNLNKNPSRLGLSNLLFGSPIAEFSRKILVSDSPLNLGKIKVESNPEPEIGKPVPDFNFVKKSNSDPKSVRSLRGKYVLIEIWAAWDKQSAADNPLVQSIANKLSKNEDSILLSMEYNGSGDTKREISEIPGVIAAEFEDQSKAFKDLGAWLIPHCLLIGPDGNLVTAGAIEDVWAKMQKELKLDADK